MISFVLFLSFIIFIRLVELLYAARNEKWLLKMGAVEYGREHYPFMIVMHVSFLVSLIVEYTLGKHETGNFYLMAIYLVLLTVKLWIIRSLGTFWNTKIYRIPDAPLVKTGLYKYIKHPNYIIVTAEIVVIPFIFQLYYTATIFSVLNIVMLYVRIKAENKALNTTSH